MAGSGCYVPFVSMACHGRGWGRAGGDKAVHAALARHKGKPGPGLGFSQPGNISVACYALNGALASVEQATAGGTWLAGAMRPGGSSATPLAPAEAAVLMGEPCAGPANPGQGLRAAGGRTSWTHGQQPGTGLAADSGSSFGASGGSATAVAERAGVAPGAHGDGAAPGRAAAAGAAAQEHSRPQAWALQRVWAHAVPSACHLAVADGAAAVACKSGVLLLLDAEIGALLRCECAAALIYV